MAPTTPSLDQAASSSREAGNVEAHTVGSDPRASVDRPTDRSPRPSPLHPLEASEQPAATARGDGAAGSGEDGESTKSPVSPALSPRFAPLPHEDPMTPMLTGRPPTADQRGRSGAQTPAPTFGSTTAPGTSHSTGAPPTPILAQTAAAGPALEQPEFAELLTPAQLRRRRRPRVALPSDAPAGLGMLAGQPLLAGPSRHGWTTDDGDLYRGATADPTPDPALPLVSNDDAVTESSGSSGSSSWSWGSGGVAGATRAVVQRIGGAIGVGGRRGSTSTTDVSTLHSSSSSSSSSSDGAATRVIGKLGRALSRTVSRGTVESTDDRPRRVHVPRRREFTLLLPGESPSGDSSSNLSLPVSQPPPIGGVTPSSTPNRVITTPVLQPVLEAVRQARAASGIANPDMDVRSGQHRHPRKGSAPGSVATPPIRRGGSAPGRSRTFAAPPVRRPVVPRTLSRLEELRGTPTLPVRPKSASDLLGMVGPRSSSATSLSGLSGDGGIPTEPTIPSPQSSIDLQPPKPRAAWWLDVSCPTWKDLRDIGELLALHPLTLEDVLHQDPREKLDTFDALGYYFVVVRALDEQYFKYTPGPSAAIPGTEIAGVGVAGSLPLDEATPEKKERTRRGWGFGRATGRAASKTGEKVEIVEDHPGKEGLEGVAVGGINLYLVVFADGIVSFHYDDVAKHTSRVRDRVLSAPAHEPTSDWIAHGLLDSIVDAFFPLTGYVDGAVDDMDSLTIDPTKDPREAHKHPVVDSEEASDAPYADHIENFSDGDKDAEWIAMEDQTQAAGLRRRRKIAKQVTRVGAGLNAGAATVPSAFSRYMKKAFARSTLDAWNATTPLKRALLYAKLFFLPITTARPKQYMPDAPEVFDRSAVLTSMTNLRRLVTGLSRLLGGKHAVVASLLKRATDAREHGGGSDVEAYLSDVHDHILLLQTSLYHYEYILANCQPAYISYLNVKGSTSRGDISSLILALSTVTIGILPMQLVTGMFSMNVKVPHNRKSEEEGDGPPPYLYHNYFAGVCVGVFLVACGVVLIVRWWRWKAREKWSKLRGVGVPSAWDGFWGWE